MEVRKSELSCHGDSDDWKRQSCSSFDVPDHHPLISQRKSGCKSGTVVDDWTATTSRLSLLDAIRCSVECGEEYTSWLGYLNGTSITENSRSPTTRGFIGD